MIVQPPDVIKPETSVAGIDLALRQSGICVLRESGCQTDLVQTGKRRGAERLAYIRDALKERVVAAGPALIALEGYSLRSQNRPFDIGEASGVVRLLAYDAHVPLIVVPPKLLKQFVTRNGAASKRTVIRHVQQNYGVETEIDDIADAVGLAHFARVYLTGDSSRRCELEAVRRFKSPKAAKPRYKKTPVSV